MPRKHKLTRRSLVNWAKRQVIAVPTWNDDGEWDETLARRKVVEKPNTVQHELAALALDLFTLSIQDYKQCEAIEYLVDMAWSGTKAYKSMPPDKLIDEILQQAENYEARYIEDLPV